MKRIVAGRRAVLEALRAERGSISAVYVDPEARDALRELIEAARRAGTPIEDHPRASLDALAGNVRHQGVIAIGGDYPYIDLDALVGGAPSAPVFVALDELSDPHNFGAIVRSAVALGADGVITMRHRAAPVTPVVVRAAAGATEHARIARVTNLAASLVTLRERGLAIVGLDAQGSSRVDELPAFESGCVLVIGSEGRGLRRLVRERCDRLTRIELTGPIASLNASVAAAIALYEVCRRRGGVDGREA